MPTAGMALGSAVIRDDGAVAVGLSNGPIAKPFIEWSSEPIDYIEVPYEQLRIDDTAATGSGLPLILHCSSLSIGGFVPPTCATVEQIQLFAGQTRTPWIGEHLAFISADPLAGGDPVDDGSDGAVNLTYTVCPQLSEDTIDQIAVNLDALRPRFDVPIILENSPQYFEIPGSTMNMPEFVARVARRCDVDLLLDLTHWMITAGNTGTDALETLRTLPLERVREVHLSGLSHQSGLWWDDHSIPVSDEVFALLEAIAPRLHPMAVTFEYNWAPSVPRNVLAAQIRRVRELLA